MAQGIQISGLDTLLTSLGNLDEVLRVDIDDECRATAYDINGDASRIIQSDAVDTGELLSKQQVIEKPQERSYEVVNTADYAGYVHFGTGPQVKIPTEWQEIAVEWKGRKGAPFSDFVAKIREWLIHHGGDPKFAYMTCIKILTNGLPARPFLSEPLEKHGPELIKRVNDLVKNAIR